MPEQKQMSIVSNLQKLRLRKLNVQKQRKLRKKHFVRLLESM